MKHLKRFNTKRKINESWPPEESEFMESENSITIEIPKSIIKIMESNNIDPDKYKEVFQNYIEHLIGTLYGQETEQFNDWCDETDNITDYQILDEFDGDEFEN
jgi:hypothetical protein